MVSLAGLSLLIVAFVNIYSVNNSITNVGRIVFNLCNVAVFALALLVLTDDVADRTQLQVAFRNDCENHKTAIATFDDFVKQS